MTGKTHIAGGAFAAAVVSTLVPFTAAGPAFLEGSLHIAGIRIPVLMAGSAVCVIASLLPDIDEPESLIVNSPAAMRKKLARGRSVQEKAARRSVGILLIVARWILRFASGVIRILAGGHRGATHWLLMAGVLSAGAWYLGELAGYAWLWIWFAAGYVSHLVLDMLTPSGLEVFRPLTSSSIHLLPGMLRVRTGGSMDTLVRVLLIAGAGALLYQPILNQ